MSEEKIKEHEENKKEIESPNEDAQSVQSNLEEGEWKDTLQNEMQSKEMKKHLRKEKRKKIKENIVNKRKDLNQKTSEMIEAQFVKVFNKEILPYTIIFIIGALALGILPTIPFRDGPFTLLGSKEINNLQQFLILSIAFTYIVSYGTLFLISRNQKIHEVLFVKGATVKIVITFAIMILWGGIQFFYWFVVDPAVENQLPFLTFQELIGFLLALVFFGWNAIQIIYVKRSIEKSAITREAKFQIKSEENRTKASKMQVFWNIFHLLLPFLLHVAFVIGYLFLDVYIFHKFTGSETDAFYYSDWFADVRTVTYNSGFEAFLFGYIPYFWTLDGGMQFYLIWTFVVLALIIFTTFHQSKLYKQCRKNDTQNLFSGAFYMLFWIFLYLKLYSLMSTGVGIDWGTSGALDQVETDLFNTILTWIIDILLMLITIINMVRVFGQKIQKEIGSKVTEQNLVLILFLLVASYWGGQMSLISGGYSSAGLNVASGLLVIIVYIIYYYWYSGWILERRGFIRKKNYTRSEVKGLIIDISHQYKENLLQTIENEELIRNTMNDFLIDKKIVIAGGEKEDAIVSTLEAQKIDLDSRERHKLALKLKGEAQKEQDLYNETKTSIEQLQIKQTEWKERLSSIESELSKLTPTLDEDYHNLDKKQSNLREKVKQLEPAYSIAKKQLQKKREPKKPEPRKTDVGELDEETNELLETQYQQELREFQEVEQNFQKVKQEFDSTNEELSKTEIQWNEIKRKFELKQDYLVQIKQLQNQIKNSGEKIISLSNKLNEYKEQMELAQPALDSAIIFVQSAEKEMEFLTQVESKQKVLDEAEVKLQDAEQVHQKHLQDIKDINEKKTIMKSEEELKLIIDNTTKDIQDKSKEIEELSQKLEEKTQNYEQKSSDFDTAKSHEEQTKHELENAESVIKNAEKELSEAHKFLQHGEELRQQLEEAIVTKNEVQSRYENGIPVPKAEENLNTLESKLNKLKLDLKSEKKKTPLDQMKIEDLTLESEDLKIQIKEAKRILKESKKLLANLEKTENQINNLKEQQIDFPQAQNQISTSESKLKEFTEQKLIPTKAFNEAHAHFQEMKTEMNQAKEDKSKVESKLKSSSQEQVQLQDKKVKAEEDLRILSDLNEDLKNKNEEMKKIEVLLNNAKNEAAENEKDLNQITNQYNTQRQSATFDKEIYIAQRELKEAHKTLKEAMRSAQTNVKQRIEIVEQRIKAKKEWESDSSIDQAEGEI